MKVYTATLTGIRDNRKFNRVRNLFSCLDTKYQKSLAQIVSYRELRSGQFSLALAVKSGKRSQMVRVRLDNPITIDVVTRNDVPAMKELEGIR